MRRAEDSEIRSLDIAIVIRYSDGTIGAITLYTKNSPTSPSSAAGGMPDVLPTGCMETRARDSTYHPERNATATCGSEGIRGEPSR